MRTYKQNFCWSTISMTRYWRIARGYIHSNYRMNIHRVGGYLGSIVLPRSVEYDRLYGAQTAGELPTAITSADDQGDVHARHSRQGWAAAQAPFISKLMRKKNSISVPHEIVSVTDGKRPPDAIGYGGSRGPFRRQCRCPLHVKNSGIIPHFSEFLLSEASH